MKKLFNYKTILLISIGLISMVILGSKTLISKDKIASNSSTKSLSTSGNKHLFTPKSAVAINQSSDNSRQSFLIATDLINSKQGKEALAKLKGLEQEYPLLAAYVLLSQGKAYQLENNQAKAESTWQKLAQQHSDSPATAEALYFLGKSNPVYWQQAITQFPAHPRTHEIIQQRLQQNPNQPKLMAILVKYTPDGLGVVKMRDRLVIANSY